MSTSRVELRRALGPWAAASIVVGTVIGSGIFLVPKTMIQRTGSLEAVYAVWVVGGVLSLAGALSYAELAAALPEAGGEYAFLREAYGPLWGFLYSWTQMWVAKSGSIATLATGFFLYLTNFFEPLKGVIYTVPLPIGPNGGPLEIQYGQLFAIALILALGWLNYYGVKIGGNVQVAVTVIKVALIVAIIVAGLCFGKAHGPDPVPPGVLTFSGFIAALVAALWAYDGWNNLPMAAGEVRDAQRNLPRATIGGMVVVLATYALVNLGYFHALPFSEVTSSSSTAYPDAPAVAAKAAGAFLGGPAQALLAVAMTISALSAMNGSMLTGARVPYAVARDGLAPSALGRVSSGARVPAIAVLVQGGLSCVLALSGTFDELTDAVVFASWLFYALNAGSVLMLRRREPGRARPFRVPGFPFVPVVFVALAILLIVNTIWTTPRPSALGLGMTALGGVVYAVFLRGKWRPAGD
jgi:APA family basic amino acid/polyamine antiporter